MQPTVEQAKHAIEEYNAIYAAGGESEYPQWADDILKSGAALAVQSSHAADMSQAIHALKPCPICQKDNTKLVHNTDHEYRANWFYFVKCKNCGCKGGSEEHKDHALAAWNTRANTPESSAAQGAMGDELNIAVGVDATNEGACVTVIHRTGSIDNVIYSKFHAARTAQTIDLTDMVKRHIAAQPSDATAQPIDDDLKPDALIAELSVIRGMFPVPPKGSQLEQSWGAAMADPMSVSAYVADCIAELLANTAQCKPEHIGTANAGKDAILDEVAAHILSIDGYSTITRREFAAVVQSMKAKP